MGDLCEKSNLSLDFANSENSDNTNNDFIMSNLHDLKLFPNNIIVDDEKQMNFNDDMSKYILESDVAMFCNRRIVFQQEFFLSNCV